MARKHGETALIRSLVLRSPDINIGE